MTCPACGTRAPEAARFCPDCGHGLAAHADQRRVVTVVFADLVGFTGLSEARDPERMKNLVDNAFERLAADITAYGGKVDKIIGDAMVTLFGAPVAHEDDAERAVRAALQMQRTIGAFATEVGMEVRMRIGVNTGEVLVGGIRAGDDYTAMGDVVNVASRLQTVASPGEVVVGPATFLATQNVVRYSDLGGIEVKGRIEAVEAWRAEEALAPPGYRPRRVRTPLVGRDAEMGILHHVLQAASQRSRPHFVLLSGEAGIGKSRLGEEIAMLANTEHDAAIYVGRCVPYGEANPWWPVSEILRQAFAIDLADSIETARHKAEQGVQLATRETGPDADRLVEGLLYLIGFEGSFPDVEPARAIEEAIAALAAVISGIAQRHLVVLFMADLHWADQVVLDLIDNLLERVRGLPIVLVATARPELQERWSPEPGRYNAVSLHLDPLTPEATTELVETLLQQAVPAELTAVLRDRSGGNPFFVEELVALLAEAGVLDGSDVDLRAMPSELSDLPATLRGLVAARLDGLGAIDREMLEDAAVVGRVGSVAALVGLGQARGEEDVAQRIDDLVGRDMLVVSDGRFEFKSDLVREVAYETLTKSSRARRHAVLADWLAARAQQTGREDEQVEAIAHHYSLAASLVGEVGAVEGAPGEVRAHALEWLERAAERTLERESNLAAEQFFDDALGLLDADQDDRRRSLLLGRAQARCGRHDLPGARADVEEVIGKAEVAGDSAQQVRALTILGEVEQKAGDMEGALSTLERAMALANESGDRAALAAALRQWGMANLFMGELPRAESAIAEAREAFHELGDRRGEAWALQNLAWIAFSRGEIDIADDRLTQSAAMFEEISDWGGRSWAWGLLGFVRLAQGRLEEAGRLADEVIEEARKAGDRWAQGMTLVLQSAVSLWLGRASAAVDSGREAKKIFETIDDDYGRGLALANLARANANIGRIGDARAVLEEAGAALDAQGGMEIMRVNLTASMLGQLGDARGALAAVVDVEIGPTQAGMPTELLVSKGLAHVQNGRPEEAMAFLDAALDRTKDEAPGDEGARTYAMAVLAIARAATGDVEGAIAVGSEVGSRSRGTYLDATYADIGMALAHAQAGRGQEAKAVLDGAQARVDASEDRLTQAIVRLARAHALEQLRDPEAADAKGEARARYEALGVEPYGWETAFASAVSGEVPERAGG